MLQAAVLSNNIVGLESYFQSSAHVHYTFIPLAPVAAGRIPDLDPYRLLVVPNGSDQIAIGRMRPAIDAFLAQGKTLFCFDGWYTAALPGNQWRTDRAHPTIDVRYRVKTDKYGLFEGLNVDEFTFHHGISGWWACGYIEPAPGADVVLEDTWGRAIVVLDEVTTPGKMFLTASGPLGDAGYETESASGGEYAALSQLYRRAITKLTQVASVPREVPIPHDEAAATAGADRRPDSPTKPEVEIGSQPIGLIFNGVWSQYTFAKAAKYRDLYRLLYVHELDAAQLANLDALVIPFQSDQAALAAHKQLIYDFLAEGKKVFVEGDSSTSWLEGEWVDRPVNNYWWVETPDRPPVSETDFSHPIYADLTPRHACWHTHGAYARVPTHARVVQRNAAGEVISWETDAYGGTLFVTTLDPIVEHGIQQITHLDHYVDSLTTWLCDGRPTGRFQFAPESFGVAPGLALV